MFGAPKEYPFSQSHIFAVFERILLDSLQAPSVSKSFITGAVKFSRAFPATDNDRTETGDDLYCSQSS
jgi:hypothetical protein